MTTTRSRWARSRRLWITGAAVVLIAGALAVGIILRGGDDAVRSGGTDETSEPTTPTCTTPPSTLPLLGTTGRAPQRAALAVKIENTRRGRPQAGLAEADVVFEEMVEGRLTRLLAVYQSADPQTVGPVRSARTTDLTVLAELGRPLFAWSGANRIVKALVGKADIVDVGAAAAASAYRRDPERRPPYNLFASPEKLRAAGTEADAKACATIPPAPFSYRGAGAPLAGEGVIPATGYSFDGLATDIRWDWDVDAQGWARIQDDTAHLDAAGAQVTVPNVLIRSTSYRDSGQVDSRGAAVPEAVTVGKGDALLLSDGRAQPGRWQKTSAEAPTTYTALDGSPLLLAPGRTWVEVLPPGTGALL